MPQLDFGTYSNVTLWVLFSIDILYICIQDFIIENYTFYNIIKPLYRRFLKKTSRYQNALSNAVCYRRDFYRQFNYFIYQNILLKLKKNSFNFLFNKILFNPINQKKFYNNKKRILCK